jgi:hypothetical protein
MVKTSLPANETTGDQLSHARGFVVGVAAIVARLVWDWMRLMG